jgi:hypothetical protein
MPHCSPQRRFQDHWQSEQPQHRWFLLVVLDVQGAQEQLWSQAPMQPAPADKVHHRGCWCPITKEDKNWLTLGMNSANAASRWWAKLG